MIGAILEGRARRGGAILEGGGAPGRRDWGDRGGAREPGGENERPLGLTLARRPAGHGWSYPKGRVVACYSPTAITTVRRCESWRTAASGQPPHESDYYT